MIIPESVTFEEAIAITQSLLDSADSVSPQEMQETITQLVKTENGARGFFVTYLTSDNTSADNPPAEVIDALQSSPATVAELIVKNLAMSAAMAVTHRRNGNEEMAQGSQRVRSRTTHLIQLVELPQIREIAAAMRESASTGEGHYQSFLQRWKYDAEQRQVICQVIDQVLPREQHPLNPVT